MAVVVAAAVAGVSVAVHRVRRQHIVVAAVRCASFGQSFDARKEAELVDRLPCFAEFVAVVVAAGTAAVVATEALVESAVVRQLGLVSKVDL